MERSAAKHAALGQTKGAAKFPQCHSVIFTSLTRVGATPEVADNTMSRATQAQLNAPRSTLYAT